MRAAILSMMLISAVAMSGAGIYTATASGVYQTIDGYGINDIR